MIKECCFLEPIGSVAVRTAFNGYKLVPLHMVQRILQSPFPAIEKMNRGGCPYFLSRDRIKRQREF